MYFTMFTKVNINILVAAKKAKNEREHMKAREHMRARGREIERDDRKGER